MAFKPIDPKRDEFRRYLERSSVIEALTKVFVRMINERPDNPLNYLRNNLGDSLQQEQNVTYLENELEEVHEEIRRLRALIATIDPVLIEEAQAKLDKNDIECKTNGKYLKINNIKDEIEQIVDKDAEKSTGEIANDKCNNVNTITSDEIPLEEAIQQHCTIEGEQEEAPVAPVTPSVATQQIVDSNI